MKTYAEIDLDETPVIVLGCGHFFTIETLDGLIGMGEVYEQEGNVAFGRLRDINPSLAQAIPRCPDCQCPIRQFCTQRFNRVINRAVIDEMSKRFLIQGKDGLRKLEQDVIDLELEFQSSQDAVSEAIQLASSQATSHLNNNLSPSAKEVAKKLKARFSRSDKLVKTVRSFCEKAADKHQPAQKLHDAIVTAIRRRPIEQSMTDLDVSNPGHSVARDRRVTFGGRLVELRAQCVVLADKFQLAKLLRSTIETVAIKIPGGSPELLAQPFFRSCNVFIDECDVESLPKLGVQATLYFAAIAHLNEIYCHSTNYDVEKASESIKTARELLMNARKLCDQPFQDAAHLRQSVEDSIRIIRKEWYEEITPDEVAAIKQAMVSGSQGMNTHSGHWYNCANGHPVSLR